MRMNKSLTSRFIWLLLAGAASSVSAQIVPPSTEVQETLSRVDFEKKMEAQREVSVFAAAAPQCFTAGSPAGSANDPQGLTFFKVCITDRGNVSHLESPAGKIHIEGREGYLVCMDQTVPIGFDAGIAQNGWFSTTVSQPSGPGKLPLIVTRISSDGRVELTQTFTLVPSDNAVQIKMAVRNLLVVPLQIIDVYRYFDGDIDHSASDDRYDRSGDAVWAINPIEADGPDSDGLMLTQAPSTSTPVGSVANILRFREWNPLDTAGTQLARKCANASHNGPFSEDAVGILILRLGSLKPSETKAVTVRYRRF